MNEYQKTIRNYARNIEADPNDPTYQAIKPYIDTINIAITINTSDIAFLRMRIHDAQKECLIHQHDTDRHLTVLCNLEAMQDTLTAWRRRIEDEICANLCQIKQDILPYYSKRPNLMQAILETCRDASRAIRDTNAAIGDKLKFLHDIREHMIVWSGIANTEQEADACKLCSKYISQALQIANTI